MKVYIVYKENTVTEYHDDREVAVCDTIKRVVGVFKSENAAIKAVIKAYEKQLYSLKINDTNVTQIGVMECDILSDLETEEK